MNTFIMFGRYAGASIQKIDAQRTKQGEQIVKSCGGKVSAVYALLGDHDLMVVTEFPDIKQAMKASIELNKALGISFATVPAIPVDEFDKLMKA